MSKPYISVLMPALNEERAIAGAITSVLRQRDVEVEVLVMDGGSTDGTRAVVEALAAGDPRIHLLGNPRSAIPHALNIGLARAAGDYIARVDCHASVGPDYLARGVARLEHDRGLAGVGGLRRGVAASATGRSVALALSSRFGVGDSINHYADEYRETDHASFGVYRTEAARAVGGWDEDLPVNEDVDFDHRLIAHGGRLGFDPDMLIDWHVRETAGQLLRQYRRYGRGKAAMVRKNGKGAVRVRHLAAPAAVLGSGMLLLAAPWKPIALAGFAPYGAGLLAASYLAWRRRPQDQTVSLPTIPASFVAMHSGWGVGFLEGLVLGRAPALASGSSATLGNDRATLGNDRATVGAGRAACA